MAKKFNIDFKKIPKPVRIVLAVLPAMILVGVMVFFFIKPKTEQVKEIEVQIVEQEKKIAKSKSLIGRLEDLKAENERLVKSLKKLEEQLPKDHEISSLLKQVSGLSHEAGLEVISWKPAAKRSHPSGIVYEIPVNVSLVGSYHKLGMFFSRLTGLERIVNLNNIKLTMPKFEVDEIILKVSFAAVTFTAADEEGLAKQKK